MRHLFPSQQDNETIHLVVREHWFFLVIRLLVVALLFVLLLLFRAYGPSIMPSLFLGLPARIVALATEVYLLILLFGVFIVWVFYYLNIQIITNLRIVDIDQRGLFSRRISELHIDKMEDVTSQSDGPFATIFGYGKVSVQTAGTTEHFEFINIPEPEQIEKLILDLYERRPQV